MKRGAVAALLLVCCLAGCESKKETVASVESAVIYTRGQAFTKEGLTFLQDAIIQYTDFATGETMPLCSRLNCPHRTLTAEEKENGAEPCMAYVEDAYQAILYREKLYVFAMENNGICIYVSDADGTNRKLLAELSNVLYTGGFATEFYGSRLVMMTKKNEISTQEGGGIDIEAHARLYGIDCETGKVSACTKEWSGNAAIHCIDEDSVYVYHTYIDDAVYERYTAEELNNNPLLLKDYNRGELWKCSLKDGTASELWQGKFGAHRTLLAVNKGGAVISISEEDGAEETVYLSFSTGEETTMLSDSSRVLSMDEDGVLLTMTENQEDTTIGVLYRFNYKDGTLEKVETDASLLPVRMLGGNLYCMKEDGKTRVMSLEDVLSGGSKELYTLERVIYQPME